LNATKRCNNTEPPGKTRPFQVRLVTAEALERPTVQDTPGGVGVHATCVSPRRNSGPRDLHARVGRNGGTSDGIVIVGGGLAAQRCIETLRGNGYEGPLRVVCGEPYPPYDRPPLSKEMLAGQLPTAATLLRPARWYSDRAVDLLLGTRAAHLEVAERRLELSDGSILHFDKLLIATGSHARTLPALRACSNVSVLRTIDDALALRAVLREGVRLAVVGAGFVGLEAAATARTLGVEVTIVESLDAPLAGIFGVPLGTWFADLQRAHGVDLCLGARLARVHGERRVHALELTDGRLVECDHVLIGIGVEPNTGWLRTSGLERGGVPVDAQGRTAAGSVFAAGDAACVYNAGAGCQVRTDHWEAAARQGVAAGRAMLALEPRATPPPSFWSDQYGVRIQYVGRHQPTDALEVTGSLPDSDFEAVFTRRGVPTAALLVGRPRALAEIRRRIEAGQHTDQQAVSPQQ
jgi:NADPH-dependent 2,4-dienoyl-CoA reductase/sulfur reductase-like enzyme